MSGSRVTNLNKTESCRSSDQQTSISKARSTVPLNVSDITSSQRTEYHGEWKVRRLVSNDNF